MSRYRDQSRVLVEQLNHDRAIGVTVINQVDSDLHIMMGCPYYDSSPGPGAAAVVDMSRPTRLTTT